MKNILLFTLTLVIGFSVFAQKKNGTVFNEHPNIQKTKDLWAAVIKNDKDAYGALLHDSAVIIYNGQREFFQEKERNVNGIGWWTANFEDFKITDDTPAFPDAIEYEEGGAWVQDWLRFSGIHSKSGIRLDLPMHCLYSFDDDGKITSMHLYFNNDIFEEISNSSTTKENGKVYINHDYITSVRKLANAYCKKDLDAVLEFYNDKANFSDATMKWRDSHDMETQKNTLKERFATYDDIQMKQVGYPDCIYYEKNQGYVVYSWWIHSAKSKADGKVTEFPIMLSHDFNDEGKIIREMAYYSSNHFE